MFKKIIAKAMKNIYSGIDRSKKKFNWKLIQGSILLGDALFTITICNSDYATQLHTEKMHKRLIIS